MSSVNARDAALIIPHGGRLCRAHAQVREYAARLGHDQLVGLVDPQTVSAAVGEPPQPEHPHPKGVAP